MKLYAVIDEDLTSVNYRVIAIFDTEERAFNFLQKNLHECYDVQEFILNEVPT